MVKVRNIAVVLSLLLASLLLGSCHKTCVCTSFSGREREYTEAEVDAHGGSCENMIMQAGTRYYSECVWR